MFNNMWDVKEPKHYSKRVGREVPGVVAVLCVVNTGPMLIAVTTITEMVILYKYVEMNEWMNEWIRDVDTTKTVTVTVTLNELTADGSDIFGNAKTMPGS